MNKVDSFIDVNLNYLIVEAIGFLGISDSIASKVRNHLIGVDRRFRLVLFLLSVVISPEKSFRDNFKQKSHSHTIMMLRKLPLLKSLVQLIHTISLMIALREKY